MSAKLLALDREMQSSSSDELQVALCSGLQHSGLAEQSRGIVGSSETSPSVSSVMSLMTKEVVEWNEDPKQGKGEETFELPGDKKSGVNEDEADPSICLLFICSNPGNVSQSRDWRYISQTQVRNVGQSLKGCPGTRFQG